MRKCRFLDVRREQEGGWAYYCGAGVNFYALGKQRDRCRICPLNAMADAPLCEHLEVYTFLDRDADKQEFVCVKFDCDLLKEPLGDLSVCAKCLHYQIAQDGTPLALAFQSGS